MAADTTAGVLAALDPTPGAAAAPRRAPARRAPAPAPSLRHERRLLREGGHTVRAAVDEVGRGALAGPVSVGVVLVDLTTPSAPTGVRDSKLLPPPARERLVPRIRRWAPAHAVGHAEPAEIDRFGIIAALRLAARRALAALPVEPDCVLLDGNHDWISVPAPAPVQDGLFDDDLPPVRPVPDWPTTCAPVVHTRIKADLRCAAVAAASVLAKVERDAMMVERARSHPGYGWELNKGYAAPEHSDALRRLGPCAEHRRSWSLPGTQGYGGHDRMDDATGAEPPAPAGTDRPGRPTTATASGTT